MRDSMDLQWREAWNFWNGVNRLYWAASSGEPHVGCPLSQAYRLNYRGPALLLSARRGLPRLLVAGGVACRRLGRCQDPSSAAIGWPVPVRGFNASTTS